MKVRSSDGWVDLSRELAEGMVAPATHGTLSMQVVEHQIGKISGRVSHIESALHMGTHIDAASHFKQGGDIDTYPMENFVGEGVILDLRRDGAVAIDRDDLESASPAIRTNDIVFINTGYAKRDDPLSVREHPYLTLDAACWLVDRKIKLLGVDVQTPDMAPSIRPSEGFDWPVHHTLLPRGILIIENLGPGLELVTGHRVEILAVPLRVRGADGAPVVPLARVIEDRNEV